jgi:hypothetical protein
MSQRVHVTLEKFKETYYTMQAMTMATNELRVVIEDIREVEKEQGLADSVVATKEKRIAVKAMVNKCVRVGNALYVIGVETGNVMLMELSVINPRAFAIITDNEKLALANRIYDLAIENATALEALEITEADLVALRLSIDVFGHLISIPMNVVSSHKEKTERLKMLFGKLDAVLIMKLDRMVMLFKDSAPTFYIEYHVSRNIINTAVRHRKETGDAD